MRKASVPRIQTDNQAQNQSQGYQNQALSELSKNVLSRGVHLQSIALTAGDTNVSHKLGSRLQGWMLVRKRSAAEIYDKQDDNPTPDKTLLLSSSADVTVDLYVF